MLFGADSVVLLSQLLGNYPKLLLLYIRRSTAISYHHDLHRSNAQDFSVKRLMEESE
jgi:hypothetical protein